MSRAAHLVLEDGSVFTGESFGSHRQGWGEVVFNTTMTGYQEVLTDPSYAGQLITLTYPIVGNYGINRSDFESRRIQAAGLIVRQHCDLPSHSSSDMNLHAFLEEYDIPGISGIDTRALTRRIRTRGVMMGLVTIEDPEAARQQLAALPNYDDLDLVSTPLPPPTATFGMALTKSAGYPSKPAPAGVRRILVTDAGLKYNILRLLQIRGCEVIAVPATTPAAAILAMHPAGVLLSPGPGDPELLGGIVDNVRQLLGKVPMMGICLGHQLAARALGARTYKLKFGHRGGNHPVKDLNTAGCISPRKITGIPWMPIICRPGWKCLTSISTTTRWRDWCTVICPCLPFSTTRGVAGPTGQRVFVRPIPAHDRRRQFEGLLMAYRRFSPTTPHTTPLS